MQALRRVGVYYYVLPTYTQGRKIIWEGIDGGGLPFMVHFPKSLVKTKSEKSMSLQLVNGSRFSIIGSDNIDLIVGTNPVGLVFSEYSIQKPMVWDYIRPILAENGGWSIFIYTPRGQNHAYDLWNMAKKNEDWYTSLLSIKDTGVLTEEDINREREEGMSEELVQQEYYCSFYGAMEGAFFANQMKKVETDNRLLSKLYDPNLLVSTAWDLGMYDSTAIWFFQTVGKEIWLIDYYEADSEPITHYCNVLKKKEKDLGYQYYDHYAPHDIKVKEQGTGKTRYEAALAEGIRFDILKKLPFQDGISAVRTNFHRLWFDKEKCARGIEALKAYRRKYDPILREYSPQPVKDWSTHASDALRYLIIGVRYSEAPREIRVNTNFEVM
jgi:hypothetical protein